MPLLFAAEQAQTIVIDIDKDQYVAVFTSLDNLETFYAATHITYEHVRQVVDIRELFELAQKRDLQICVDPKIYSDGTMTFDVMVEDTQDDDDETVTTVTPTLLN